MNISTYESQIKALEAGGGGGGGSSDGVFVINIDRENRSCDKTFSEVKSAVLNKTPIFINFGTIVIPDFVNYIDDSHSIAIQLTMFGVIASSTPSGYADSGVFQLHPNDSLTMDTMHHYTFTITEA